MTDRFWELVAKKFSGQITSEEQSELEKLLLDNPQFWLKSGITEQLSYETDPRLSDEELATMASNILGKAGLENEEAKPSLPVQHTITYPVKTRRRLLKITAFAMLLIIMAVSGIYFFQRKKNETITWKKITTAPGMKASITLADGSIIWLNAASTLRYPENMNNNDMEVFLSGEAYFKIRHDPKRTFIIHAKDMDIRDLGTEFNVRAYPEENFSETSLISGAVAIAIHEKNGSTQNIQLKPDQKIVVSNTLLNNEDKTGKEDDKKISGDTLYENVKLKSLQPVQGNIIPETAWKDNTFIFNDEPLTSLAVRMERWYGVKINIENKSLVQKHFTGRADNISLNKLLEVLQKTTPFHYKINEQEVTIY